MNNTYSYFASREIHFAYYYLHYWGSIECHVRWWIEMREYNSVLIGNSSGIERLLMPSYFMLLLHPEHYVSVSPFGTLYNWMRSRISHSGKQKPRVKDDSCDWSTRSTIRTPSMNVLVDRNLNNCFAKFNQFLKHGKDFWSSKISNNCD